MNKKVITIGIIIFALVALLAWAFIESNKPLPGIEALQEGRSHILDQRSKINYKFNPPTSGDHYPSWITKGFYDEPRPDGNVVHSEEHGYVILWYDCQVRISDVGNRISDGFIPLAYAQGLQMTAGSEGSPSAKLSDMPKSFSDGSCESLKSQLKGVLADFGPHKLIAMPRAGMDSPLILTAWGRMEKLSSVDRNKIKEFIDTYRDHGPEQTDEP